MCPVLGHVLIAGVSDIEPIVYDQERKAEDSNPMPVSIIPLRTGAAAISGIPSMPPQPLRGTSKGFGAATEVLQSAHPGAPRRTRTFNKPGKNRVLWPIELWRRSSSGTAMLMSHAVAANVGCPEVELNHYLWTFKPALAPRKLSGRIGDHGGSPRRSSIRLSGYFSDKASALVVRDSHLVKLRPVALCFCLVRALGVEPRFTESESGVLPVGRSPIKSVSRAAGN